MNPRPSHYARAKTDKVYLGNGYNLSILYREFLAKKGVDTNDKPPLSRTSFVNIFKEFNVGFERPRSDTCATCDLYDTRLRYLTDEEEIEEAQELKERHHELAENLYDWNFYDFNILQREKNQPETDWTLPPIYPH